MALNSFSLKGKKKDEGRKIWWRSFRCRKDPKKPKQKNPQKTDEERQIAIACPCTLPFPPPSPRPHLCVPLYRRSLGFCAGSSLERRWAMVAGGCSGERRRCWEGMETGPSCKIPSVARSSGQRTAWHKELALNRLTGLRSSVPCLQTFFLCTRAL